MDLTTMNDIGIMVCAAAGVALFYWIGRDHDQSLSKESKDRSGQEGKK